MDLARAAAPPRPLYRLLLHAALIAWAVSLVLPAFLAEGARELSWGRHVMLGGFPVGWMVNGWAVYANVFFLVAAWRMHIGKAPGRTIGPLLFLTATLPFFQGVPRHLESGTVTPVASWGWGALFWLVSLALLVAATMARDGRLRRRGVARLGMAIGLVFMAATALYGYQWWHANEPDRLDLLGPGMIFSVSEFCPVALAWPVPLDAPAGEAVVLDIDPLLRGPGGVERDLPAGFGVKHADGSAWRWYRVQGAGGAIMVREKARPGTLVLQFKADGKDAVLRLLKGVPQRVLYEQPLHEIAWANGDARFCPLIDRDGFSQHRKNYDDALISAMGLPAPVKFGAPLPRAEEARERCDFGKDDIDGIEGLRHWDGREVIADAAYGNANLDGFCSASYMALVRRASGPGQHALQGDMFVYDRKTLKPLAVFTIATNCPDAICGRDVDVTVEAIRFDGRSAELHTTLGNHTSAMSEAR